MKSLIYLKKLILKQASSTYNNGILLRIFKKKDQTKPTGKQIKVDQKDRHLFFILSNVYISQKGIMFS